MTNLERAWLHLFRGNKLSDQGADMKFGYCMFSLRAREKSEDYCVIEEFIEAENGIYFKRYYICPLFLLSERGKAKKCLNRGGVILAVVPSGKVTDYMEVIKEFKGVFDNTNIDTTLVKIKE